MALPKSRAKNNVYGSPAEEGLLRSPSNANNVTNPGSGQKGMTGGRRTVIGPITGRLNVYMQGHEAGKGRDTPLGMNKYFGNAIPMERDPYSGRDTAFSKDKGKAPSSRDEDQRGGKDDKL